MIPENRQPSLCQLRSRMWNFVDVTNYKHSNHSEILNCNFAECTEAHRVV